MNFVRFSHGVLSVENAAVLHSQSKCRGRRNAVFILVVDDDNNEHDDDIYLIS